MPWVVYILVFLVVLVILIAKRVESNKKKLILATKKQVGKLYSLENGLNGLKRKKEKYRAKEKLTIMEIRIEDVECAGMGSMGLGPFDPSEDQMAQPVPS